MTEFFIFCAVLCVLTAFVVALAVIAVLYIHTAWTEHIEGRHRTAFWGFGLIGILIGIATTFGVVAAILKVLS